MVRSDQFTAPLDVLAGDDVGKADDAAADAVAGFDHRDVVAGLGQFVRRREAAEAGADDDHAPTRFLRREVEPVADQQHARRRQRPLNHLPPGDAVRLAVTPVKLRVKVRHKK